MHHAIRFIAAALFLKLAAPLLAVPTFEKQVVDSAISIGYGLAIGDVDGDGKPDVLLADKSQIAWYRNGDWKRFVMAEHLNPRVGTRFLDNVCIAARDIDGDGRVEVAVGGNWNPGETTDKTKSGSVHYLVRPEDPTARWTPLALPHEPTVHRMRWIKPLPTLSHYLAVLPLHGVGNKGGEGAAVRMQMSRFPEDPADAAAWETRWVDLGLHATHNFDVVGNSSEERLAIGGKEGVAMMWWKDAGWHVQRMPNFETGGEGVGEVRLPYAAPAASIEPLHGNRVAVYSKGEGEGEVQRTVIDESLNQGHALDVADLDKPSKHEAGTHEVIAGWRSPDKDGKVGIKIYQKDGDKWTTTLLDDNTMACEDLKVADLDADGLPEIIAAGRATKNVVIYWNKGDGK